MISTLFNCIIDEILPFHFGQTIFRAETTTAAIATTIKIRLQ